MFTISYGPAFEMFLYTLVTLFLLWLLAPSSKVAAPENKDEQEVEPSTEVLPPFESPDVRSLEEIERDRQEIEAATLQEIEAEEMRDKTALDVLKDMADELHQQPIQLDSDQATTPRVGWAVETQPDYTERLELVEEAPPAVEADPLEGLSKTRLKTLAARLNKLGAIKGYSKMEPEALKTAIRQHPHFSTAIAS